MCNHPEDTVLPIPTGEGPKKYCTLCDQFIGDEPPVELDKLQDDILKNGEEEV